jgi:PucR C-terminal helix-turn-helix domain/GGDEF-like domain
VPLTQVLGNLIETLPDLQSEILLRVWGSYSYDENHLDPADLSSRITYNVEWLLHTLAAGTTPGPPSGLDEALAVADEIGRSRAIQGVAVDAVIRSWRIAEQVLEESLIARSAEIETGELLAAIRRLGSLIGELTDRSAASYRSTQEEVTGHYDRLATDLVAQIVSGTPLSAEEIGRRAQVIQADPAETYAAVAVGLPERDDPATHSSVQRRLLGHLGPRVRGRILIGSLDDRPLFLVPTSAGGDGHLCRLLTTALGPGGPSGDLLLGVSSTSTVLSRAYETARQARLALEVGQRLGMPRGVIPFADVAVEALLLREPDTAAILLRRIAPLLQRPELLETLRAYITNGYSARAAARSLYVHPNTVPHRLRSIRSLIGADASDGLAGADIVLALRWLDLGMPAGQAAVAQGGGHPDRDPKG